MNIEITRTLDGSDTLYLADLDEHYHSTFGAIQESMHVFIRSGLEVCSKTEICILEIGFGTGLNCFLTCMAERDSCKSVTYFAFEKYPLPVKIIQNLNFGETYTPSESFLF
jgi:tRNA U34 5-methylaminomethyl-2-thiouridine-forming methyltransferase MnmC